MNQLELFKMFCGNDEIRPAMLLPFEWNGKICATDSHKLIRCDKAFLEFELTNPHKGLNTDAAIPKITCNRIIANKLEDFEVFKTEDELVKNGKDIECAECDGDGEVEWEYGRHTKTDECPVCDGKDTWVDYFTSDEGFHESVKLWRPIPKYLPPNPTT